MDSVKIDQELLIPAGRHTLPPREVAKRQKKRLLRALVTCVSDRGYRSTTITDVVRMAQTSRSAFYEHFADKEHCFLKAYEQVTATFIGASVAAAASAADWRGKLDAGISASFRWAAEHPEASVTCIVQVHSVGARGLEARSRALRKWTRMLEGVAMRARHEGMACEHGEVVYSAIVLTAEGYVHDYARRGCVNRVQEKAQPVQALARMLFEQAV